MLVIMTAKYETIPVINRTKSRINHFGNKGETYDQILNKLLDEIEETRKRKK